jgi:hypothetical protein
LSVGAVLIQPQRLDRTTQAQDADSLAGDLATLVGGIALDAVKGGHILESFGAAVEAAGPRLLAQAEDGLAHARDRLTAMLSTPVAKLQEHAEGIGEIENADDALAAAHDLLAAVVGVVEELTIDHIRQHVEELLDIVEHDLGLTPDFLEQQVWTLVDDIVDRLEHVTPESDESLLKNRLGVIGAIRRLTRALKAEFSFPELEVERIAEDLLAFIRNTGLPDGAARAACIGAGMAEAAQSGRAALHAVPFTGLGTGSISAGVTRGTRSEPTEEYLWYPSWLATNSERPSWVHLLKWIDIFMLIEEDRVVRTSDAQIILRRWGRRHEETFALADASKQWKDKPRLPGEDEREYVFGPTLTADALEKVAFLSSIATNLIEIVCHLSSLERGDYASNTVNAISNLGLGTWKAAACKPLPWWFEGPVLRFLPTFFATLEGRHTKASAGNRMLMWLTLAGPDLSEMYLYRYFAKLARDLVLSTLTLINHEAPESPTAPRPRNVEEVDAWRQVAVHLFVNLYLFAFEKKNWGVMKPGDDKSPMVELIFFWGLLGGAISGCLGGLLGCVGAQGIARQIDNETLVDKLWWGVPQALTFALFWLYMRTEGHTDDGKFTPFSGAALTGYPPRSSSPYLLPYSGDCYVGQANQGIWSHNFNNVGQLYAVDFSLDAGDEILAARGGTVVNFWEGVPDETNPSGASFSAVLAAAIPSGAPGPPTITVDSTNGFSTPGILSLDSNDIAFYTSLTPTQFQGVTWQSIPTPEPANNHAAATTLTTPIAAGSAPATVDVTSTQFFPASGSVVIDGNDTANYTSIAGNQLQGVTWNGGTAANAHAAPGTPTQVVPSGRARVTQQTYGWNFVAIRHDTPVTGHDVGQGGTPVTTIGVYGHGQNGSVTAAFARHSPAVPTNAIIGSTVVPGMPIMLAGDTGISFHNHLHMHVVVDTIAGAMPRGYLGFGGSNNPGVTLPFVFSDVGGNGVPWHFDWYLSGNTRVPPS